MVPGRGSKETTQRLLEITDMIVVTGSQNNVRRAYTTGTPALGSWGGQCDRVIVDETADLAAAAQKIAASKTFDNATSCSLGKRHRRCSMTIYDAFVVEMSFRTAGGALIT